MQTQLRFKVCLGRFARTVSVASALGSLNPAVFQNHSGVEICQRGGAEAPEDPSLSELQVGVQFNRSLPWFLVPGTALLDNRC